MADSVPLKKQIQSALRKVGAVEEQIIPASKVVLPGPARSYASSTASFDQDTEFDSPTVGLHNNFRPMWRTPDAAIQQNKVITTKLPPAVTASGIAVSPSVTSAALVSMPDMSAPVNVQGNAQVQVSWQFSGALSTLTASAAFALFRDNIQIGPTLYGNSPANGAKFSVAHTFIDTPPPGVHSYAVYWSTTAGTLTADGKGRVLHALTLRPQ
jgi:hypothetical protein